MKNNKCKLKDICQGDCTGCRETDATDINVGNKMTNYERIVAMPIKKMARIINKNDALLLRICKCLEKQNLCFFEEEKPCNTIKCIEKWLNTEIN